jgi:thioredoxin-like negative regulator of GroEL
LAPIVHGLEAEYRDRIKFSYLDIDDPATDVFKQALGYRVQPQLFLLDGNGEILQQWLGYTSESQLRGAFEQALQ